MKFIWVRGMDIIGKKCQWFKVTRYNMDRLTTIPIRQSLNGGDAVRLLNETGRRVIADLKRVFKTNTMEFEKVRSDFFRGMMI